MLVGQVGIHEPELDSRYKLFIHDVHIVDEVHVRHGAIQAVHTFTL